MDLLRAMSVFRRVVELKQFAAAARDRRLSNAAVSKEIASLEDHLGTKLLNRTTRRVSLTPAGAAYYERCVGILDEIEDAERSLSSSGAPRGRLRVNVPMAFGLMHISPLLPEVLARYPELSVDVSFTDRFVDVAQEGSDLVIRIATELPDSATLVVQRLARTAHVLCASPEYLKINGEPLEPRDLLRHECLVYAGRQSPAAWTLGGPGGPHRIQVRGRLIADNSLVLREAAVAGAGIAHLPSFYIADEIARGKLAVVLARYESPPVSIHALHQRARHVPPKVRAFVEFLRERWGRASWATR